MTDFQKELLRVADINVQTRGLISEDNAKTLENLTEIMLEVNKTLNVTAIRDNDGVILKHLVDSVACVGLIDKDAKVCDIGCGGGFPTFPIAILRRDVSVLAVDSVSKKVAYVEETAKKLSLDNIKTSNRRAEELGRDKEYREKFDTATARALGKLSLLCELCLPLVRVGGTFIAMKSLTAEEELKEAENAIKILGAKVEKTVDYTLTNGEETVSRTMIVLRKIAKTPDKYPRNNSQISKKPL